MYLSLARGLETPAARSAAVAVFDAAAPAAALQPTAADVAKKKAEALEAKAEQLAMELDQKRLEMVSAVTHASQQAGETKKVWRLAQVQGGEAFGCVCLSVCRKCGAWCVVRGACCVMHGAWCVCLCVCVRY